jgi:hypothetical protein
MPIILTDGNITIDGGAFNVEPVPGIRLEYPQEGCGYGSVSTFTNLNQNADGRGFSFSVTDGPWSVSRIDWWLRRSSSTSGDITCYLWTENGSDLPDTLIGTSTSIPHSALSSNFGANLDTTEPVTSTWPWVQFNFPTPIVLSDATKYVTQIHLPTADATYTVGMALRNATNDASCPTLSGIIGSLTQDASSPPTSLFSLSTGTSPNTFRFRIFGTRL